MEARFYLREKLQGEYAEAFDKVELYTTVERMQGDTLEEMLMNLLDSLLTAQSDGRPVEKIVGTDIERFCQNYFQDYSWKTRVYSRLKSVNGLMWFIFITGLIDLFFLATEDNFYFFTAATDTSGYLVGGLIGFLQVLINDIFVKPFIFKTKKITSKSYEVISTIVILAIIIASAFITQETGIKIPVFPQILLSGIYIAIYSVFRYKKYGWNNQEKHSKKELEKQARMEYAVKMMAEGTLKRYENINKRRARKGKENMTEEAFTEKLIKENASAKKWDIALVGFCVLFDFAIVFWEAGKSTVTDTIIFAILIAVIQIAILYIYYRFIKPDGISYMQYMLQECEKQEMTVIEYAKSLQ